MSASIVKVGSHSAIPRRLDGQSVVEKNGMVTIEYKEKGLVKTKTASYPKDSLIAYQVGTPGFVIDLSSDPITQFVGEAKNKDGKLTVTTEAGIVVVNQIQGVYTNMSVVDPESREARTAERAGKVKVKMPRAAKPERTAKVAKKSSKEEAAPAKKVKTASRTEAVVVKKKKKNRS